MTEITLPTSEQIAQLKRDAGLTNDPTALTYHARLAMRGDGDFGYEWKDKPHRLVYRLCAHIENAERRLTPSPDIAGLVAKLRTYANPLVVPEAGAISRLLSEAAAALTRIGGERLTAAEIDNILAMYAKYDGDNPFFSFNMATRAVIDKLERMRAAALAEKKEELG